MRRRVVLLRGTHCNLWDLRPWEGLVDEYDVEVLVPSNNLFDTSGLHLRRTPVRSVSGSLPSGRLGALATRAIGERYVGLEERLRGASIVHSAELGYWYSWQAARLKRRLGFQLALTVWETLPFVDAYRNFRTRRYRREVLSATDVFLPTTERARRALLLEGAPPERMRVLPPGIDVERFGAARTGARAANGSHLVVSIGRLVWEKGHQDVLRAVAALDRNDVQVLIVGEGPEKDRLRGVAADLDLTSRVEFRGFVPYDELPLIHARASCLVLASLPTPYWEEQFGMVLPEAMAAHLPIVAAASGAIPEVLAGSGTLFEPGDWVGLAERLADGPLASHPGTRRAPEADRLERFSREAATERLRAIYRSLLP